MRVRRAIVIAVSVGLSQCSSEKGGDPKDRVGAPCTPTLERDPAFAGFKITETTLEAGAPECGGGICLVNHFQGRVSCPLGQPEPADASGQVGCTPEVNSQGHPVEGQGSCLAGELCRQAASLSPACDFGQGGDKQCQAAGVGSKCNAEGFCECSADVDCLGTKAVSWCDPATRRCLAYACQGPGGCQQAGAPPSSNAGKVCCPPGGDAPVLASVCGQCKGAQGESSRGAEAAVYCTCRCGVAEGQPEEPDSDFCTCPDGFECAQIRPYTGVGDKALSGLFCIKAGTRYEPNQDQCVFVDGYWVSSGGGLSCAGAPTNQCLTEGGPCKD
jgi:hypothetical protein